MYGFASLRSQDSDPSAAPAGFGIVGKAVKKFVPAIIATTSIALNKTYFLLTFLLNITFYLLLTVF